jgi:8-oxo-dGTP pyrophosphatase MutT (NUDIX family)
MSFRGPSPEIVELDGVEIAVERWQWDFARKRRAEIERHFALRQRERRALWNGRLVLVHGYSVRDGVLRGSGFETDYASFLAWRDWGLPDAGVFNIFASAAVRSADGAYLVGRMARSTANAGMIYFPSGAPDLEDITADGALDLAGSVGRELLEETGLDIGAFAVEPTWTLVRDRGILALMKRMTACESAEKLRAHIVSYLVREPQPEFSDIRIVRNPADFDPAMPAFLTAYLAHSWSTEAACSRSSARISA